LRDQGEVVICRYFSPGMPMEFVVRLRNRGFWNERLLVFDSFTDSSVKAVAFVEVLAFQSAQVRELLKHYPQGAIRVKQIVLRRLWKFAASKASIRHAIVTIEDEQRNKQPLKLQPLKLES
jgi:hypothetical protein